MSLWTRLRALFRGEKRTVSPTYPPRDPALLDLWGARVNASSGVAVTEQTAMSWTALAAGARLIHETQGSLPLDVYERTGDRKREERPDHPAAQLFKWPNEEQTGSEAIDMIANHAVWWGNGLAQIIFDGARRPIELWPMNPDRVTLERNNRGALQWRVSLPNAPFEMATESTVLPYDEVLHIRGFSRYGLWGERMAQTFKEAIGLGLATEMFGALFFGQGAQAGGIITHPGQLSDEAQKRIIKQKENQIGGISRVHKLAIFEEGMTFAQTTVDPQKSQFIELRKFQVTEAARILRVPPHMLYDLERATFTNIEHQALEFVKYTMTPWCVRWEQRLAKHLLGRKDFSRVYFKFNLNGLLRGDMAARMAFYQSGIQHGWLSQNDVRAYEDLNPIAGGDTYRAPVNLIDVKAPPPKPDAAAPKPGADDDDAPEEDARRVA